MPSIHDPLIQSSILPLVSAILAITVVRLTTGASVSTKLAGIIVGLVSTSVAIFIVGAPSFPPAGATQKLIYVLAASTLFGFGIRMIPSPRLALLFVLFIPMIWVAWPLLAQGQFTKLALVLVAGLILALPLRNQILPGARHRHLAAATMILIGLAVTAITASAASVGQIAAVTAAAAGGFLMWNWPRNRFDAAPALVTALAALAALSTQLLLFTRAGMWPALVIAGGVAGQTIAGIVNRKRDADAPLTLVISTVIPAIGVAIPLVILIATQPATSSSGY